MNDLHKRIIAGMIIGGLLVFFSFACSSEKKSSSNSYKMTTNPEELSSVVLRVGSRQYTNADFERYLSMNVGPSLEELPLEVLQEMMDNFIEDKLLLAAAEQNGLVVTWPEIKNYLARMKVNPTGPEPIQTSEELELLKEALLIEKYMEKVVAEVEVSPEELHQYYQQHKRDFLRAERIQVSQILVDSEEKAVELRQQLKNADEAKFREFARQYSLGVEAPRGGVMGIFEMGQLPYAFDKVVFTLEEGQLSPVIESSYGYHIFRVDRKFPAELVPFEKAKEEIRIKVLEEKIKNKLSEHLRWLKDNFDWAFFPENLTFPYQRKTND
ncbi:MAG: hypothetical protein DRJ11_04965 [Candidatus Aminicenantes bacterium]|nr:MAG: hypothetical protein DRJ11_04965 [Candidatus Aminicenantes bacterium]